MASVTVKVKRSRSPIVFLFGAVKSMCTRYVELSCPTSRSLSMVAAMDTSDQGPSPALFTARTWMSWLVLSRRPVIWCESATPPVTHTSCTTVQTASSVSLSGVLLGT